MAKLRPKTLTTVTRVARDCAECAAPIGPGEMMQLRELPNGRRGWVHKGGCNGRLIAHLAGPAPIKPAPKEWHAPPSCPECGALMTKSSSGGHSCHLAERHASREVVRISSQGWRM